MNILVNFDKGLSKFESSKFDSYIKFLELDETNHYFFINRYRSSAFERNFPSLANIKNLTIIDHRYESKSWKEFRTKLDSIIKQHKIDRYVLFYKGIFLEYRKGASDKLGPHYKETLKDDAYMSKMNIVHDCMKGNLFDYYISVIKKIPSYHVVSDPQEIDLIKNRFFFYEVKEDKLKSIPYVEYGFLYKSSNQPQEKIFDLTFGCTILSDDRKWLSKEIQKLENIDLYNIFYKDKYRKVDTLIKSSEYNDNIAKSKYTLIIPSYDNNHFSSIRFFEAISMRTIPLILKGTNIELGLKDYPHLLKLMKKYVVEFEDIQEFIDDSDYESAIEEIFECKDIQKLLKGSYYKKKFEEFFTYSDI